MLGKRVVSGTSLVSRATPNTREAVRSCFGASDCRSRHHPSRTVAENPSSIIPVRAARRGSVLHKRGNFVTAVHGDGAGFLAALLRSGRLSATVAAITAAARTFALLQSIYEHLAGPGPNNVPLPFSFVPQGTAIARMDNTGQSVWPHLHFQLQDARLPLVPGSQTPYSPVGASRAPNSLDQNLLRSVDDGKCCMSTIGVGR